MGEVRVSGNDLMDILDRYYRDGDPEVLKDFLYDVAGDLKDEDYLDYYIMCLEVGFNIPPEDADIIARRVFDKYGKDFEGIDWRKEI